MSLTKQIVSISELFHAPLIDIKNKARRILQEQLWCSGHKKYLLCKRSIMVCSLLLNKCLCAAISCAGYINLVFGQLSINNPIEAIYFAGKR